MKALAVGGLAVCALVFVWRGGAFGSTAPSGAYTIAATSGAQSASAEIVKGR